MANDIINLPNSFIQWCGDSPETCNDYNAVKLPIYNAGDLAFMLQINATTTVYLDTLAFLLIKGDYDAGDVVAASDIINGIDLTYALISGTNYAVWGNFSGCDPSPIGPGSGVLYPAAEGECVSLVLVINSTKVIVCKSLQPFYFTSDLCWTNLIRYRCADDSFGFHYEVVIEVDSNYYNQIRLPITLHSPHPLTEKTGFRKSNGEYVTLAAKKAKEWEVDTDYFTDHMHQCLDAAVDHDELFVFEDLITGCDYSDYEFYHDEADKYDIDWQEKPGHHLGVAKAKFKLKTNPYYAQNSNC